MISRRLLLGISAVCGAATLSGRAMAARLSDAVRPSRAMDGLANGPLAGKISLRGENGYEALRRGGIWNARKPDRYPSAIVMAETDEDVAAAVRLAKAQGWKVGVRSGGHSWTAPHTRDNGMTINLSRMKEVKVDKDARVAVVSPAYEGQALNKILRDEYGLMFPTGHCYGVGLGGFVMCGGHGWNSRLWGPACANLRALDLVTAEGTLIHASASENSDYLWAARGGGPGFFGVALRYYLDLHPLPTAMKRSSYTFAPDAADEIMHWALEAQMRAPKYLELSVVACQDNLGHQIIRMNGAAIAYSEADADAALALMEECPAIGKAVARQVGIRAQFPLDHELPHETNPSGGRYEVDGTWTNATAAQIMPAIREFMQKQVTPESYFLWMGWGAIQDLGDMAYSLQGHSYFSPCGISFDPADDERCAAWVAESIKAMEPFSRGGQMNDENMAVNKRPYLSPPAAARLAMLQKRYDPAGVFAGFLK